MAFQKGFSQKVLPVAVFGLVLAANLLHSQTKIEWKDSLVVREASHFITAPRVNLLADGTVLAVWGESSSPNKIWCSRLENGQFATPVSVVTTAPGPALFGFGGFDVAVHGQKIYVVFERNSGIFLSRSEDGGASFLPPVKVSPTVVGGYATLASMTADEAGNLFVDYIQEKNGTATHQMCRSTDGGQTFSSPVEASAPADGTNVCECCIAAPLASEGSVWLAFRNNNANIRDHWVSRSTDLASTFDTATDVDDSDWAINVCPISGPRMARSGDSLLLVWKTGAGGGSRVFASTLHGPTMEAGQQVRLGEPGHLSENQNQPDIVSAGDTLGTVFQESNERIVFAFSVSGLQGLPGNYTRFESAGQELAYPSLAFRDGIFHLVYANSTTREVIYRRGKLVLPTATNEAAPKSACPICAGALPMPSGTDLSKAVRAEIFDLAGRLVRVHEKGNFGGASLDVSGLPTGAYWMKMSDAAGRALAVQRFFKR